MKKQVARSELNQTGFRSDSENCQRRIFLSLCSTSLCNRYKRVLKSEAYLQRICRICSIRHHFAILYVVQRRIPVPLRTAVQYIARPACRSTCTPGTHLPSLTSILRMTSPFHLNQRTSAAHWWSSKRRSHANRLRKLYPSRLNRMVACWKLKVLRHFQLIPQWQRRIILNQYRKWHLPPNQCHERKWLRRNAPTQRPKLSLRGQHPLCCTGQILKTMQKCLALVERMKYRPKKFERCWDFNKILSKFNGFCTYFLVNPLNSPISSSRNPRAVRVLTNHFCNSCFNPVLFEIHNLLHDVNWSVVEWIERLLLKR